MDFLGYIKEAARYKDLRAKDFGAKLKINLITNFTDDILKNLLVGACLTSDIYPEIYKSPYGQYHLELKNAASELHKASPDITFIFFDINPFKDSAFRADADHFEEILSDIERYCAANSGTVIVNSFIVSYQGAHGNLFKHSPLYNLVHTYNKRLEELSERLQNLTIFDTNRLVHFLGESRVFDLRNLYAFDIPFTHEFMTLLAEEWFAYARALMGRVKKCIVVDLDNTLWGGVVGELGATGIALGPDYPGNAFVNFQRALLDFHDRGIILAINSKNNAEDVTEVFKKNPHMVLNEDHFSATRVNWGDKAENLAALAKELNIGTESIVFLDDDPLTRAVIQGRFPEVTVPDLSVPPEDYVKVLYGMNVFHQLTLTDEDKKKGKMYAEERKRKTTLDTAKSIDEYIAELGIKIHVSLNEGSLVPRIAQLTQKTNQYNLTTKRYTEAQIKKFIADGTLIFSANVTDKFGDYGTVVLAIVVPQAPGSKEATLDTFLMSCRVMGRGIECAFMDHVLRELHKRGITKLHATFVPTAKNEPAKTFLADHGFGAITGTEKYALDTPHYMKKPCSKLNKAITITT